MLAKKNDVQQPAAYSEAMDEASKRYDVNTTAEKVHKRDMLIRIVAIILAALLLFLGIGFSCTTILNRAGRFTVSLTANDAGIQLSDVKDFSKPTLNLYADHVEGMTNITKPWMLNKDGRLGDAPVYADYAAMDQVWGSHNVDHFYLAYTFGVRNPSSQDEDGKAVTYRAQINIESQYLEVDEAVRVMVYRNGVPTTYAKARKGTTNMLEKTFADKCFVSKDVVMQETIADFQPGQTDRYTVIMWLEGEDPECVNDILGGEIKLSMHFDVIGSSGTSSENV